MMHLNKKNRASVLKITFVALIIFLAACKKELKTPAAESPDAKVAFISVSPQLSNDLIPYGTAYVLKDITDTNATKQFLNTMPALNIGSKMQYPTTVSNTSLQQPWIEYLHLPSGPHLFTLVDTSHFLRVRDQVNFQADKPVSIYYADSLGHYRSFILPDDFTSNPGEVGLRFLNFSPDAGNVFFTIDEKPASASGFVNSFKYGQITPFVNYPNPRADTLRVNFFQASDSTTVIASAFVQAAPGHAYTLALQGYLNGSATYFDPKNHKLKTIQASLSVQINNNN